MSTTVVAQPTPDQDQIIRAVFSVANMAIFALGMVPGIPANVILIVRTGLTEVEAAYAAYMANPTADLYDEITVIIDNILADIKADLHP